MIEDVRFAFRQLRKNPGFAIIAVMTLGLGIGAAAAIFGLIQGVLLSPPPYAEPDRLVLMAPARTDGRPFEQGSTVGEWMAWRRSASIDPPALYRWTFNFLVRDDGSESLGGMVVTRNYFHVLGIRPVLGREFTEGEASHDKTPASAIILGYDLWQRRFNGNPAIIGTTLRISRQPSPLTVVGVMPPGVRFLPDPNSASEPNYDVNARVDFWTATTPDESRPKQDGWNVVARLRPGATAAQAQSEAGGIMTALAKSDPDLQGLTASVSPVEDELNHDASRSARATLRVGCSRVPDCLRERRWPAGRSRLAAAAGIRDALSAWRRTRQAVPSGPHRERHAGARQRRRRRRACGWNDCRAQDDWRRGRAQGGCRSRGMAGLCVWRSGGGRRGRDRRLAARAACIVT